ncbi:MAG: hypothetical protein DCC43_06970 [Candidatus Brocadia sp.]|uniref:Rubrerythrin n=1 Tax=Candidatus Brocadia fulgida TaxID=380242 RepID=A0A0M2UW50_9BACT|nr:MAG: putative rubrerythrin [Candidatus Brocadia fulgida]MCC6324296.1 ferritin family protein [Candidatus Brocadia sp.]MCE7911820.1 hypothetical protein [Candidatus Brocadia sp. AMX3]MBV6519179.1 hypothetical protein [Candidatus Brocadia fulgida]MDG5997644.1 hypothetical protein [Candidatus Brocadia sp.]
MSDTLKEIKSIALQMETDGVKFYSELADKTLHPMGRAMFRSFVEDEKAHIKRLRALLSDHSGKSQAREKSQASPGERLVTIFKQMGEAAKKKVDAGANDIAAVKLAMELEEKGTAFYEKAARETEDAVERETYRFLAGEEKVHFSILKNTLDFLEKTALWEAEKEGRIYDMWIDMVNKKG